MTDSGRDTRDSSVQGSGQIHRLQETLPGHSKVKNSPSNFWLYQPVYFPGSTSGQEPACQRRRLRDSGSIPGSGRSPGGGQGNLLQYPCLENPMERGAWRLWSIGPQGCKGSDTTEVTQHTRTDQPETLIQRKHSGKRNTSANFQAGHTNRASHPSCYLYRLTDVAALG